MNASQPSAGNPVSVWTTASVSGRAGGARVALGQPDASSASLASRIWATPSSSKCGACWRGGPDRFRVAAGHRVAVPGPAERRSRWACPRRPPRPRRRCRGTPHLGQGHGLVHSGQGQLQQGHVRRRGPHGGQMGDSGRLTSARKSSAVPSRTIAELRNGVPRREGGVQRGRSDSASSSLEPFSMKPSSRWKRVRVSACETAVADGRNRLMMRRISNMASRSSVAPRACGLPRGPTPQRRWSR